MNHLFRVTNADGRIPDLLTQEQFIPGKYMIRFETEAYFKETGVSSYFYPYVEVINYYFVYTVDIYLDIEPKSHPYCDTREAGAGGGV